MENTLEQIETVQPAEGGETQTPVAENEENSLGRFKSTGDLIKAYTNLEREFTKKSQRLKALEQQAETPAPAPEKEYMKEDWQSKVQKFVQENPSAAPFKAEIADEILNGNLDANPDCLELALSRVLLKNYKAPSSLADNEEFLEANVYKNDKIRDRIIKDYLCSISDVRAVKTIGAGGQPAMSPRPRPKTIGEAGRMVMEMAGRGK